MTPLDALRADAYRQFGQLSLRYAIKGAFGSRTFRVLATMRLCQHLASAKPPLRFLLPFFRLLHRASTNHAAVDLPWQTAIGGGLAVMHGWGLVVNQYARIGKNVTLFHGVTIGQRDRISRAGERATGYPTLEDEVWVGPHAIIVGDITIGRGSRIAGGAFVAENVPANSIVMGNPAYVAKAGCVPDVANPAPI